MDCIIIPKLGRLMQQKHFALLTSLWAEWALGTPANAGHGRLILAWLVNAPVVGGLFG